MVTDLNLIVNKSKEQEIDFEIKRNNETIHIGVTPKADENGNSYIGVNFKPLEKNLGNSLYYGFLNTISFSGSIIDNLKELARGGIRAEQLTGPIGISSMVSKTTGFGEFVYILALISLSLGITNLLPFPPLDGGKILILLIEAIRRKKMNVELEMNIQTAGFILMILLSVYVAYNDILRIF